MSNSIRQTTYELLPTQYDFLFGFDKEKLNGESTYLDVSLYQGGFTCKKATAEWLSPRGWRTMDKLTKDDLMAVYHPETKSIKFEHPKEVFCWNADEWYEIDTRGVHQINCPNHRMYTIKDGKEYIQSMSEYYEEHNNSKNGHRGKFVTTFSYSGDKHIEEDILRLAIAYQADGYSYVTSKYNCAFHLTKERKLNRLIYLLDKANISYSKLIESNGDYRVKCKLPLLFKTFPEDWYELDSESLRIISDEVKYWDGSIGETNQCYYTSIKSNADFVQFACSASGYKATLYIREREHTTEHRVKYQNNNVTPSICATRNKTVIKKYKALEGEKKYCPSTSTKLWLCREFGRITVTGNSGKTFCGSLRGLLFALKWAGCRGLVGAASQDLLDGTTKQKYLEHMENIGFKEGVHWWYSDRKQTINFMNGSTIRFKTLSDWSQFRSTEFTWIEIEEASLIDEKTFKELMARIRQSKKEEWKDYYRCMFLHTNPQGSRGWMFKNFHNKNTRNKNFRAVIAATRENVHLGEGYADLLETIYSAEEIQELLNGIDCDYDNTVAFPNFNQKNVIDNIEFDSRYPLILTCDFNYNPMCWYLVQQREDNTWYILKELIENNVTTKEMCERILPIIAEYGVRKLTIMGDSHGRDKKTNGSDYSVMLGYFSSKFMDCTLRVQKSNPRIKERLSVLRGCICNAKGERRLFVDSSCKHLLYNFDEAKNNLANAGLREPTDKEIQDDDKKRYLIHPIDAISYPIHFMQMYKDMESVTN